MQLKATEALRLGSMLIEPLRGSIGDPGGPGCAWGMMLEAAGWGRVRSPHMMTTDLEVNKPREWRWLFETHAPMPKHVCCVTMGRALKALAGCVLVERHLHINSCIMHLFDAGWTANQIADWLEPFEKEEERRQAALHIRQDEIIGPQRAVETENRAARQALAKHHSTQSAMPDETRLHIAAQQKEESWNRKSER